MTLLRALEPVGVHGGHHPELGRVDEVGDALVLAVALEEVLAHEVDEGAADGLVAVHVGHPFEHGLAQSSLFVGAIGDSQYIELALLNAFSDRLQLGQVGVLGLKTFEKGLHLLVGVVGVRC